jgi:FtsP/CotA-like multicopper oxidase with cupredoxin domain
MAPYWIQPEPSASFANSLQTINTNVTKQGIVPGGDAIVVWALNDFSLNVDWEEPMLTYLMDGNSSFPNDFNVIPTVSEGGWNFWLIQQSSSALPIPHPIHLHGHDLFVLGQGTGTFDPEADFGDLNFATPPRCDTATVSACGWLVLVFESNNPGAWLMQCHIAWHVSEGLAVQFLEAPDQIVMPDRGAYQRTCDNWKAYESGMYYPKDDSGV